MESAKATDAVDPSASSTGNPSTRASSSSSALRDQPQEPQDKSAQDAARLIERLIGPCEGKPDGHAWQKCSRCCAMHLLENRDKYAVRLLTNAIEALAGSRSTPSPDPQEPK